MGILDREILILEVLFPGAMVWVVTDNSFSIRRGPNQFTAYGEDFDSACVNAIRFFRGEDRELPKSLSRDAIASWVLLYPITPAVELRSSRIVLAPITRRVDR